MSPTTSSILPNKRVSFFPFQKFDKMLRAEQKCRITMEIMLEHNLVTAADVTECIALGIPENIPGVTE